ncbi:MAG: nuclease [Pasteurellales bacterium]|nr:MAG: nuclease [Pasteurellales bacterium]
MPAQITSCRVTKVSDGDTIHCKTHSKKYKVRLLYIDAPESSQTFGIESKKALAQKILHKKVTLNITKKDHYGRTLAEIYLGTTNINLEMVKQGYAWEYRGLTLRKYTNARYYAQDRKLGLWQYPNPIEPKVYRQQQKNEKPSLNTLLEDIMISLKKLLQLLVDILDAIKGFLNG